MDKSFSIDAPAVISFSGGRTSGYMLRRILDAHNGGLPWNTFVIFADTGKEHPGTLDFVAACARHWSVAIHTVKMAHPDHATPYDALIARKKYLPNTRQRFCTTELKIEPMRKFMKDRGFTFWRNYIGLRYDEPTRLKRQSTNCDKDFENMMPLALARITKPIIMDWWAAQPFDLEVPAGCGNCVGCFMKGREALIAIEQQHPGSLQWYADKEKQTGGTFRPTYRRETYGKMIEIAKDQGQLFETSDKSVDCLCTD